MTVGGRADAHHALLGARVARAVGLVGLGALLGGCALQGTMAPRGGDAETAGDLWWYMLALGGAIFVGWLALFAAGLARRSRSDRSAAEDARTHRRMIVGGGLVLPTIALGSLFVYNLVALEAAATGGDVVVDAAGHQFWWEFTYPEPGITTANEMYIPTGTDVQVRLTTDDVIHSFWVPQLAGKRDMVPGRVNSLVLHANHPGRYVGECAEYCGIQHANMRFQVVAVPPDEYEAWLRRMEQPAAAPDTAEEMAGHDAFLASGCGACHTIRGTPADGDIGPPLTHLASREWIGAGAAPNDRGHLGGWVVDAQGLKPGNHMPPMQVDADALDSLLTYLESLE